MPPSALRPARAAVLALTLFSCNSETDGASTSTLSLEAFCPEMARRYCEQDRPCCEKAGFGFNVAICQARYLQGCGADVEAVKAGKATFHPEKMEECLRQYQPFIDTCLLDPAERVRVLPGTTACAQVFRGLVPIGGACASASECAPLSGEREGFCGIGGMCADWPYLAEGAACDGGVGTCAPDLSCNFLMNRCEPDPKRLPLVSEPGCRGP